MSRQQLNNILSGRAGITPEMAVRLEKAIGSNADHWLRLQIAFDLAQVRRREAELVVTPLRAKVA